MWKKNCVSFRLDQKQLLYVDLFYYTSLVLNTKTTNVTVLKGMSVLLTASSQKVGNLLAAFYLVQY